MTDTLIENVNAEGCVLGSMLLDRGCIPAVRKILADHFFFSKLEHRIIYDSLCQVYDNGQGWDLVVIRDALKSAGNLAAAGGVEYLVKLAENVPSSANAEYYAQSVRAAYTRRRIAEQAESLHRAANEPGNIQDAIQAAQSDISELADEVAVRANIDGAEAVKTLIDDSIQQRRQIIRMPWSTTGKLTHALQPGTVTILCGSPGASKSFAGLELLDFVSEAGHPAAIFELEDSQAFHLMRMLAQKTETPGLTNSDWIAQNPSIAEAAYSENVDWLTRTGNSIDADGGGQLSYERLTSWAISRARAGAKLLIIDPVTAIQHQTRQTWTEDNDFLQKIKRIAVDYGTAVLLVSHPTKAQGMPSMESLAGGASFSRFAQTILWLEAHEHKTSDVRFACGRTQIEHNRTIHILKSRLGQGHGIRVAASFSDGLRLIEHGAIVRKERSA